MAKKRKAYVVSLVIIDSGAWPDIKPQDLWQHMDVKLPSGLIVEHYRVRREDDPEVAPWVPAPRPKRSSKGK